MVYICIYPRAGYANKLLVYIDTVIMCDAKGSWMLEGTFMQLPLMSMIRRKLESRMYVGCKFQNRLLIPLVVSVVEMVGGWRALRMLTRGKDWFNIVSDFHSFPRYCDPYVLLKQASPEALERIRERILGKTKVRERSETTIAVHIRRGDFHTGTHGQNSRTCDDYFVMCVEYLRGWLRRQGITYSIQAYTDDKRATRDLIDNRLRCALSTKSVEEDFRDIAEADIVVVSPWSTFSGLAACIGKCTMIVCSKETAFQFADISGKKVIWPEIFKSLTTED